MGLELWFLVCLCFFAACAFNIIIQLADTYTLLNAKSQNNIASTLQIEHASTEICAQNYCMCKAVSARQYQLKHYFLQHVLFIQCFPCIWYCERCILRGCDISNILILYLFLFVSQLSDQITLARCETHIEASIAAMSDIFALVRSASAVSVQMKSTLPSYWSSNIF